MCLYTELSCIYKTCTADPKHVIKRTTVIEKCDEAESDGVDLYVNAQKTPHKNYNHGLCLQYYPHGTLRSYLSRSGAPTSDVLRYASQLVATLTHIHASRVVHCDLSCNNVFIDDNYDL
ncbi:hypothetical protein BDD12DRAFT_290124 [Trichophaea hybrida]|nr:hypothetical protein BDD12DRAFT_290124 [Trichophaea hybrida]